MQKIVYVVQIIASYLLFIFGLFYSLVSLPFQLIYLALTNKEESNSNQNNDNSLYADDYCSYNFKRAITAIEFYKIKDSDYPNNIDGEDFETFLEEWGFIYDEHDYLGESLKDDLIYLLQKNGYELNLNQEDDRIKLELPPTFWKGLGIVKTNAKGFISISEN
ncbi:MAG: hypothetical protein ACFCAD_12990 [Pleurocapsa sp.]